MPTRTQLLLVGAILGQRPVIFLLRIILTLITLQVILLVGINIMLAVSLNLVNGYTGQFSLGHAGFMAAGACSLRSHHVVLGGPKFLGQWLAAAVHSPRAASFFSR